MILAWMVVGCFEAEEPSAPAVVLTEASAAAPAPAGPALVFSGDRPRNVLMLSIDTLRRDRVGRYDGSGRTPFLDRLLREGVALDHHRSCSSWTLPSVACALSGRYGVSYGHAPSGSAGPPPPPPAGVSFLTDLLAGNGMKTAMVTANPFLGPRFGMGVHEPWLARPNATAAAVTAEALPIARSLITSGSPWLLHVHVTDPHTPYVSGTAESVAGLDPVMIAEPVRVADAYPSWPASQQAAVRAAVARRYDAEVEATDRALAAFFDEVEAAGGLEGTLVVVWSDHGEQHWEHGNVTHGWDLHDEEAAAIAGFWAKSGLKPRAWTGPTSHVDLVPTLLEALGLPPDGLGPTDGAVAGTAAEDRPIFAEVLASQATVQTVDVGSRRLRYHWLGRLSLYDLAADPDEGTDLLASFARTSPDDPALPPDVARLWSVLGPRAAAVDGTYTAITAVAPGADPTAEQLAQPKPWGEAGHPAPGIGNAPRPGAAGRPPGRPGRPPPP